MKRRETYVVVTSYVSIKRYDVPAASDEDAKQLVREGYRENLLDVAESFHVEYAYRKGVIK